jgi:hypothetical protein
MTNYNYQECFHLENDNLLYFSMEHMLPILRESSKGLSAPYLGKDEMTFGVMYVKYRYALEEFTTYLNCQRDNQNDMKHGYQFFLENRKITSFLPTCSNECEIREEEVENTTEGKEHFRNLWDAAPYGPYMGGTDPNYTYIPQFVNDTSSFRSDQFTYSWYVNPDGLRIPQLERHGNSWLLYNLHVHCKYLEAFASWFK